MLKYDMVVKRDSDQMSQIMETHFIEKICGNRHLIYPPFRQNGTRDSLLQAMETEMDTRQYLCVWASMCLRLRVGVSAVEVEDFAIMVQLISNGMAIPLVNVDASLTFIGDGKREKTIHFRYGPLRPRVRIVTKSKLSFTASYKLKADRLVT